MEMMYSPRETTIHTPLLSRLYNLELRICATLCILLYTPMVLDSSSQNLDTYLVISSPLFGTGVKQPGQGDRQKPQRTAIHKRVKGGLTGDRSIRVRNVRAVVTPAVAL